MAANLKKDRRGKYFLLRSEVNPSLILEINDGLDQPGAEVVIGEVAIDITTPCTYQLWYTDRMTRTIRSKLNDFCLDLNASGAVVVNPYVENRAEQDWIIVKNLIQNGRDDTKILSAKDFLSLAMSKNIFCCTRSADANYQHWVQDYQPPDYFYIKRYEDITEVLDIRQADPKPGARVIMFRNKGDLADNQLWYEDESGIIRSKLNGYVLDASGKSLQMLPLDSTNKRQHWIINGSWIQNLFDTDEVLQYKSGSWLTNPTVRAVLSQKNQPNSDALWKFDFIPDQANSLNHSGCGKHFVIRSRLNGLVLSVNDKIIEAGCSLSMDFLTKDSSMQSRQLFYEDQLTGTIRNNLRNHCISISDDGTVVLDTFDPYKKTQQWRVCGKKIQNRLSLEEVLEVRGAELSGGERPSVGVAKYSGEEKQHWEVMNVPARCFYIVSLINDKVLDVSKDDASSGARVVLYDRKPNLSVNQLWYEDERGVVRSKLNGYILDGSDGGIRTRPHDPTNRLHEWIIVGDRLQNRFDNSLVLDIKKSKSSNGAQVISYRYHGGENQRWKFDYIEAKTFEKLDGCGKLSISSMNAFLTADVERVTS